MINISYMHMFPIFWSLHLITFSHRFQFRALLKAVGFEGIVVEKRETEKMENKTKVPLQTFYLPHTTSYVKMFYVIFTLKP